PIPPARPACANDRAMEGADQSAFLPVAADAQPRVTAASPLPAGVPCYQCAYDLAGLLLGGVCPECGLAISASWPRRAAGDEERRRVDRVRGRVRLVLAAAIALLVASASLVLWACGCVVNAGAQRSQASFEDGEVAIILGFGLSCAALLVYAVLATVLAVSKRTPGERARLAVRIAGPLMVVGMVAIFPGAVIGLFFVSAGGALALLVGNAACVMALLGVCGDMLTHADRSRPPRWLTGVLVAVYLVVPITTFAAAKGTVAGAGIALAAAIVLAVASAIVAWHAIRGVRAVEYDARRPGGSLAA
ncbi:MAG: hypothetical protein ACIAQU_07540, partial [Phycisphaerales bacterium JB064]